MKKYNDFFEDIKRIQKKQIEQQKRGLNDYNILTSVLKEADEVKLHSRMIFSLLNPRGKHYQGTLFLELFIEILKLKNFYFNFNNAFVYKEYENIDLYITDGNKHIIIENKIHASDQENQISRYVAIIKKENKDIKCNELVVIYLSLDRAEPTKESLGELKISNSFIEKNKSKVSIYKSIHYKKEIMDWLKKCKYEVSNITNLNESIKQYIDVVNMVNNNYKGKVLELSSYIRKNKDTYKTASDVYKAFILAKEGIINDFFDDVIEKVQLELGGEWVVKKGENLSKKYSLPITAYKKAWNEDKSLTFSFQFGKNNFEGGYIGICKYYENINIKNDVLNKFSNEIESLEIPFKTTAWWLHSEGFPEKNSGDFSEYILFQDNSEEKFIKNFLNLIEISEGQTGLISKINTHLNV